MFETTLINPSLPELYTRIGRNKIIGCVILAWREADIGLPITAHAAVTLTASSNNAIHTNIEYLGRL